jgi:hypothetical protein
MCRDPADGQDREKQEAGADSQTRYKTWVLVTSRTTYENECQHSYSLTNNSDYEENRSRKELTHGINTGILYAKNYRFMLKISVIKIYIKILLIYAVNSSGYAALNDRNNELERIWKGGVMSMFVLWVVMLCGLVGRYQRFLHLQG